MEDKAILDLIDNAKKGSENAFKDLIIKYKGMGLSNIFSKIRLDEDERYQLINIAIFTAIKSFNPKKKSKFSTLLQSHLKWHLFEQDAVNRTGKKVDALISGRAPKLEKILDEAKIEKLHRALYDLTLLGKKYTSPKDSFSLINQLIKDEQFYNNHRDLFAPEKLTISLQKDIQYYNKAFQGGSLNYKLKNCMKKRIHKMNFYLINYLSPFYLDNEFNIQFENEFEDPIYDPHITPKFEYTMFYEEDLFHNLTKIEKFVVNYLHNLYMDDSNLYRLFFNIKPISVKSFIEVIDKKHKLTDYEVLCKLFSLKLIEVRKIEEKGIEKIKQNIIAKNYK